jgi:hypothetical protein
MKTLHWGAWLAAVAISLLTVRHSVAATAPEAPPVCADPGSSLLWEVRGGALDANGMTLHLFGSIHVGKREFYPLHPAIESRFRGADHLVFEIDPQAAADPQVALRMQMRGMLPAGQTLPDVVSPEAYANLQATLTELNIPMAGFINLKPWLLTLLLANFQANALGYNAQYGLEAYFIGQKAPDSTILELESIDQQVDMLDSLDPELLLGYSLDEFDTSAADMENMIDAWQCGDKAALSTTLFDALQAPDAGADQAALDVLYDRLYTQRNLHMAEGIENFIATGTGAWFVVVGSAHLLGAGSIVDLLQQRGYQVNEVRLDP